MYSILPNADQQRSMQLSDAARTVCRATVTTRAQSQRYEVECRERSVPMRKCGAETDVGLYHRISPNLIQNLPALAQRATIFEKFAYVQVHV